MINSQFKKFEMEMHVGKIGKASKTKCIFFPPPGFFNQELLQNDHKTQALHDNIRAPSSPLQEVENVRAIQEPIKRRRE